MIINKIWYDFSNMIKPEEIAFWTKTTQKGFEGNIEQFSEAIEAAIGQSGICAKEETEDREVAAILITDKISRCVMAREKEIPFLLYLHKENENADFKDIPYAVNGFEGVDVVFMDEIYRRFRGIPWTILETERLLVRETTEDDLDALYEVYADPSITRYTENLYEDRDWERAYIKDYIKNVYTFCGYGIWSVIHKESGKLIGRAGLACRDGFDTPELGYVIAVPYQKQGYATEVCRAILKYADERLGFEEIRVLFQPENAASLSLCRKLGFEKEGEMQIEGRTMLQYIYRGIMEHEEG